MVGDTEKTKTDIKRARRSKKKRQHIKRLAREEKEKLREKLKADGSIKETKRSALKDLEKKSRSHKGITLLKVLLQSKTRIMYRFFVLFLPILELTSDIRSRHSMAYFFGFTTIVCFCYVDIQNLLPYRDIQGKKLSFPIFIMEKQIKYTSV